MNDEMKRWRFWFHRIADLVSAGVLVLSLVVGGMNLADWESGPLRRLVHLPAYFGAALLGLSVWHWRGQRTWLAVAMLVLGLSFAAQPARLWLPRPSTTETADRRPQLSVMGFNVYRSNHRFAETLALIEKADADVVFLTEMAPGWHAALAPLRTKYAEALEHDEDLLVSRFPLWDARCVPVTFDAARKANDARGAFMLDLPEALRPHWWNPNLLTATVQTPKGNVRLVCMHPPTPASDLGITIQRAVALIAADELKADNAVVAKVLMGDFNTSPFSPTFRFIVRETGLFDSAQGFGYRPTWGPRLPREPLLPWIGSPIDHFLASGHVRIIDREVGPPTGSDHRWLLVRMGW